jgi:hypothetical protein
MLLYAPQRQMLPLMRSRNSTVARLRLAVRSALAWLGMPGLHFLQHPTAEQICPGVQ